MSYGSDAVRLTGTQGVIDRLLALQDRLVETFDEYGVAFTYYAFGFVFLYFGLQKPAPVASPIRAPVEAFVGTAGIPIGIASPFIGWYEIVLGTLFLFRRLRLAFFVFLAHQAVAFLPLVVIPYVAFQPPWLDALGMDLPWALDWFSAFILKNTVFVGAFMLLASRELGGGTDAEPDGG